jgi:hypothetical protein
MLLLLSTGCTLKATFDTTSDATSNFLSSTTPGAWYTEDGLLRAEQKVTAFTAYNQTNLEQDLARGQGEYLTSLGTLLGVADDRQASFRSNAQDAFGTLLSADQATRVAHLRTLAR